MKKPSPKAVLRNLTTKLRRLAREANGIELDAYVGSAEFREQLGAIPPNCIKTVMRLVAKAMIACDAKMPLIERGDGSRRHWDAAKIAKFHNACVQARSDESVARIMGMTAKAVWLARRRHPVAHATSDNARAA